MKALMILVALAGMVCAAAAQPVVMERTAAQSLGTRYDRMYETSSQITFRGVVTGIQSVQPSANFDGSVSLLVKNDEGGGTAIVEVGPTWFVARQALQIHLKGAVQVTGSKVKIDGGSVILAKLVQVGTEVLALRRPNGVPYWHVPAPIVTMAPDESSTPIEGSYEGYRIFGEDGSFYSGLIYRSPYNVADVGPNWYGSQNVYFMPFGNHTVIATPGTFFMGPNPFNMGGYRF